MGEMFQATLRLGGVFGTLRRSRRAELEPEDLPAPLTSFRSSGNEALFAEACARWDAALGAYEKARKCTASLAGSKRQQLGRIFVRSQLYGGLRRWCAAGVAISALGGLLGTIGRFLVLQSIVHGVQYGHAGRAPADARRQAPLERPMMKARDRRVAGVKQAVECIKAVKFYAWEEQYRDAIGDRRDAQLKLATAYRAYVILSVNIGKCFPVVAGAITILTVAAQRGGTISAAKAFGALAVFQTLRVGMIMLPLCIVLVNTMLQTFQRIGDVLVGPEDAAVAAPAAGDVALRFAGVVATRDGEDRARSPSLEPAPRRRRHARRRSLRTTSESLAAAAPALAEEAKDELLEPAGEPAFSLALDDLTVRRGSVVAVVGPVGAGKSTAVEAALGRVEASGDVTCDASVGYAPQDPFVATGTILENVLLGRALDEAAFAKAVNLAAFERDLELLPDGRDTVVGERGTTLSGGQQHRLGVARAAYGDPRLLLLDALLAAVDAAVARRIFDGVKAWTRDDPKRAAVLVLSQLHFLPECDQVVLVDDGAVLADGPAAALAAKAWDEGSFGAFVRDALAGGGGDAPSKSVDELVAPETPKARGRALDEDKADALVKKEKVARGVVSAKVLLTFFRAVGYWRIGAIVFGYCFAGAILAGSDVILARWTGSRSTRTAYPVAYAVGCVCYLCVLISSSLAGVVWTARGSRGLHRQTLKTVLGAPVSWFEANPSGRILSRFAADFDVVDIDWGNMFDGFLSMATMFFMLVVMISAIVPYLIPINLFVSVGLIRTLNVINTANRDVKRIANNAVSPTVTTAAEMARGRVVSRVLRCGAFFRERQRRHVDAMLGGFFQSTCISQAAYGSATLWCSLMALSAALLIALVPGVVSDDVAPVALTYALVSPYFASMMSEVYLQMSIMATSLERVAEYLPKEDGGVVPQEPARDGDLDALADAPGAPWPASGRVEFVDVGVVGRTGAGKSTLLVALFRLVDVASGVVRVDGVDVAKLGLRLLRRRLCMIPQEAVLMSGTAKDNCDPFDEFAEGAVADALEAVGLARSLLHAFLGETSLSTGERQLLALARALLRKSAVVAFDEATAHVDASTDAKIQAVVETQFPRSTLLAIAHRLHTVIGFDRIVVMDRGTIAEQGPPLELLDRARGPFATMTAALGAAAERLATSRAARWTARPSSSTTRSSSTTGPPSSAAAPSRANALLGA
ncbi:ATPase [Aureococcus anophagefferens]|nr:ATPase [Aureococcus anophagefferens]